jgi:hypothetical protein
MTIKKHLDWYIASIGCLSACSRDRREAKRLVLQMFRTSHGDNVMA